MSVISSDNLGAMNNHVISHSMSMKDCSEETISKASDKTCITSNLIITESIN
jgi:hypothetical protein